MKLRADVTTPSPDRLTPLVTDWPTAACGRLEVESSVVRVIVASVRGSAPREPGACMLVDRAGTQGTIGGGHLEYQATSAALEWLAADSESQRIQLRKFTLGADLAQCCGGVVQVWLERLTRADRPWLLLAARSARQGETTLVTVASRNGPVREVVSAARALRDASANAFIVKEEGSSSRVHLDVDDSGVPSLRERVDTPLAHLWLHGAGHVGRAVVHSLAQLPFQITWLDARAELLPVELPPNVRTIHAPDPVERLGSAPARAYHLVMTHDHAIDFDLCHAILTRAQFAWLGLIGSASKAAKFRARLARAGMADETIARLVSPIGVGGVTSKLPAAIAVTVAMQLLQELERVQDQTHAWAHSAAGKPPLTTPAPILSAARPTAGLSKDECSARDCASCTSGHGARQ